MTSKQNIEQRCAALVARSFFAFTALITFVAAAQAANVNEFINFSSPTVPGRLYVPPEAASTSRPLILFLHGSGETGSNNLGQINPNIDNLLAGAKARGAFLYAPQATTFTWGSVSRTADVMSMIDQALVEHHIDPTRLYVTGLSMGGGGVWDMYNRFPNRFAAAVPIAAVSPSADFDPAHLVGKPAWPFHARNDATVTALASRAVVNEVLAAAAATPLTFPTLSDITTTVRYAGGPVGMNYTEFTRGGHGIWGSVYNSPEMYEWMFSKTLAPAEPVAPAPSGQVLVHNITPFLPIADPSGLALPAGAGFMAVGAIGLADDQISQTNASSLAALSNSFVPFGASVPLGVNSVEGLFAASVGAPLANDDPLMGQHIYIVAGDGRDIASSNWLFVFKSDLTFTAGNPGFGATIALGGDLGAGTLLLGTPGVVHGNRLGSPRQGILAARVTVPEPTTFVAAVAMLSLTILVPARGHAPPKADALNALRSPAMAS
jgi:poly(3-hydroxybutyrate) depolymerase